MTTEHPTFEFLLDAWAYLRLNGLTHTLKPVKITFKLWGLVPA